MGLTFRSSCHIIILCKRPKNSENRKKEPILPRLALPLVKLPVLIRVSDPLIWQSSQELEWGVFGNSINSHCWTPFFSPLFSSARVTMILTNEALTHNSYQLFVLCERGVCSFLGHLFCWCRTYPIISTSIGLSRFLLLNWNFIGIIGVFEICSYYTHIEILFILLINILPTQ